MLKKSKLMLLVIVGVLLVGCSKEQASVSTQMNEEVNVVVEQPTEIQVVESRDDEKVIYQTSNMEATQYEVVYYYNKTTKEFLDGITLGDETVVELLMEVSNNSTTDTERRYSILDNENNVIIAYESGVPMVDSLTK